MNASEQIVEALEQHGVKYVFGIPGEENLPFMEALRTSSVEFVLTRHEQAAGFMAAAYGKLTGTPGVCMATLGAGATNLTTPLAHALLGGAPMIAITGQKPIRDNLQGRYQILNVTGMMTPITKWSHTIESGSSVPSVIQESFRLSREHRQGPVHLELPLDVSEDEASHPLLPVQEPETPVASDTSISGAAEIVRTAQRPVLLIGTHANRTDVSAALRSLSGATGIPFVSTMLGKGVIDERSPLYLGTATRPGMDYVGGVLGSADVILAVGHDVMESPPFVMQPGQDRTVIHINYMGAIADTIYFPQHQVTGDIAENVRRLTSELEGGTKVDVTPFKEIAAKYAESVPRHASDTGFPLKPQYIAAQIRDHLAPGDIVTLDNGIHKMWMTRNYPTHEPLTNLGDGTLGSMGMALPYAMTASLLNPERKIVAVIGDGGFEMSSQELETAVRLGLNLTVVIFNDHSLGMIKAKQMRDGVEPYGVDFSNPDFVKLADSYGATGHRPLTALDFGSMLATATKSGGVHVIDAPINFGENIRLMQEMAMVGMANMQAMAD